MNSRFLITTAVSIVLSAAAYAQAPSSSGSTPSTTSPPSGTAPANNNQAQQAPAGGSGTTAQQPSSQTNTSPSSSGGSSMTNVSGSVNLNEQQRTRISQTFSRVNVRPVSSVNFSISAGTIVPRDIRVDTVPAEVVEIVPQFRGYSYFAVRDEIVIVEPSSSKIVAVLPHSGDSTAAAPAGETRGKAKFSDQDRDAVRKHTRSQKSERRTTGSSVSTSVRVGERLPDSVEIQMFPETVYRDAPALREYRYIERGERTYVIEPRERVIIDEIE